MDHSTILTWQVIEDQVTELLIIAFEAGFAVGCGRPAAIADDTAPLMAEIRRRWEERLEATTAVSRAVGYAPIEAAEMPEWLRELQQDAPL